MVLKLPVQDFKGCNEIKNGLFKWLLPQKVCSLKMHLVSNIEAEAPEGW